MMHPEVAAAAGVDFPLLGQDEPSLLLATSSLFLNAWNLPNMGAGGEHGPGSGEAPTGPGKGQEQGTAHSMCILRCWLPAALPHAPSHVEQYLGRSPGIWVPWGDGGWEGKDSLEAPFPPRVPARQSARCSFECGGVASQRTFQAKWSPFPADNEPSRFPGPSAAAEQEAWAE